jgi:uncharacterized protein
MDWSAMIVAGVGLALAGILKGATGLGYASCALPFLTVAIGLQEAMVVVLLPAMATNFGLALATGHFVETLHRFKRLYVAMLPGIICGIWLLIWIDQHLATRFLGLVMVSYVILALTRPLMAIPTNLQCVLQYPTGFLNGVITGVTGAQVMPLFPYIMGLHMDPSRTVQAINLAVMIASTALGIGLLVAGVMTRDTFLFSIIGTVPALAGVGIGNRVRQFLPVERFRRIVLLTLLVIGTLLVLR